MSDNNNENNIDYINERMAKAKEILEKKYNDAFEIIEYRGQQMLADYYEVKAVCKNNPDLKFTASVEADYSGVSDSYAAKMVSKRFSDIVSRNLNDINGYVYVFSETFIKEYPLPGADISVEDFSNIVDNNLMKVFVFICEENETAENMYSAYQNSFKSLEAFSGTLAWYIVDEDMLKNIQKYIESNISLSFDFIRMTEKNLAIEDRFVKGLPQMSKDNFVTKIGKCL